MLMIRPKPWATIGLSTRRVAQNVAFRFQSSACSQASSVRSSTSAKPLEPPALFTRMWTVPKRSIVASTSASTSAWEVTSPARNAARSPASSSASAAAPLSALRPEIITDTPSARNPAAIPLPMPWVPPVITATFPFNLVSNFIFPLLCVERGRSVPLDELVEHPVLGVGHVVLGDPLQVGAHLVAGLDRLAGDDRPGDLVVVVEDHRAHVARVRGDDDVVGDDLPDRHQ